MEIKLYTILLFTLIILLFYKVEILAQKESILIGGVEMTLGMQKSEIIPKLEKYNFVEYQDNAKAYNIWDSENKMLMIGVIQFSADDKLNNATKFWPIFSDNNCNEAFETLFTLLTKYKNDSKIEVNLQEIFEPKFKVKLLDYYIGNRNITMGLKDNGEAYINESLQGF